MLCWHVTLPGRLLHWTALCTQKVKLGCAYAHDQFCRPCVITQSHGNRGNCACDLKYWNLQSIKGGSLQEKSSLNLVHSFVLVVSSVNMHGIVTLICNDQNSVCSLEVGFSRICCAVTTEIGLKKAGAISCCLLRVMGWNPFLLCIPRLKQVCQQCGLAMDS